MTEVDAAQPRAIHSNYPDQALGLYLKWIKIAYWASCWRVGDGHGVIRWFTHVDSAPGVTTTILHVNTKYLRIESRRCLVTVWCEDPQGNSLPSAKQDTLQKMEKFVERSGSWAWFQAL